MRAAAVAWLLAAACAREPRGAPPPSNEAGAAVSAPADAGAPDADAGCVAACVRDSQMRATSPETIAAECEAACRQAPPAP